MSQPTIDPTFYRTRCGGRGRSCRAARLRGGLRPGRAEARRDDRRRRESGLRQLRAGGRLDRRPRARRRAAPLRLERLQQRAQARGPQHGRPRPPLPPGAGPALVEHLRARHRAGPAPADAGQDDRRQDAVREGRLLPPAHPALRTRRGLPHLPRRRRGRRRRAGRDRAARPRDVRRPARLGDRPRAAALPLRRLVAPQPERADLQRVGQPFDDRERHRAGAAAGPEVRPRHPLLGPRRG